MRSPDINAEGVVHALQLAGDRLRLTTATPDQLNAAAAFLAKALARFPDVASRDPRRADAIDWREERGRRSGRRSGDERLIRFPYFTVAE